MSALGGDPLAHGQDIPLAILEPGSFRAPCARDAVLHLDPWHVILLEYHPSRFEFCNFGGDVLNDPECGTGLRRAHTR